jgi:hypothetical protein
VLTHLAWVREAVKAQNAPVWLVLLDLLQHIFVKASETVHKAALAGEFPLLFDRLTDARDYKLAKPSTQLLRLLARGVSPSYVFLQMAQVMEQAKGKVGKSLETVSGILWDILTELGIGEIRPPEALPIAVRLGSMKSPELRQVGLRIFAMLAVIGHGPDALNGEQQAALAACEPKERAGFRGTESRKADQKRPLEVEIEKLKALPAPTGSFLRRRSGAKLAPSTPKRGRPEKVRQALKVEE